MTYDTVKKITAVVLCGSFALGSAAGVACAGISSGIGEELGPHIVNAVAGHKILPLRAFAGCLWPVFAAIASGLKLAEFCYL